MSVLPKWRTGLLGPLVLLIAVASSIEVGASKSGELMEGAQQRMEYASNSNRQALLEFALAKSRILVNDVLEFLRNSSVIAHQKAYAAFVNNDFSSALTYMTQVVDIAADEPFVHTKDKWQFAEEWSRVGHLAFAEDPITAIAAYEKVLSIEPDSVEALSQLAFLYIRVGALEERLSIIKRLRKSPDPEGQFLGYFHQGFLDQQRGEFDEASIALEVAIQIAETHHMYRPAVQARVLLAGNLLGKGSLVEAGRIADNAREISRAEGYVFEEASAAYQQAIVLQYTGRGLFGMSRARAGRVEGALVEAQLMYQEISAEWQQADVLAQRARLKQERRDYDEAKDLAAQALRVARKTGNVYAEAAANRVSGTLYSVGPKDQRNAELSNKHFDMAVQALHGKGFEHLEGVILAEWATALDRLGWRDAACSAARRSLQLFNKHMRDQNPSQLKIVRSRVARFCR